MRLLLATICAACLTTAACDGDSVRISTDTNVDDGARGILKVVDTLQCPETIGILTRKGVAQAGGASCVYSGPRGAEVTLQLVPLADRSVDAVLTDIQQRVSAELPHAALRIDARQSQTGVETASVQAPGVDIKAEGDDATVSLPGIHIATQGDNATVRIAGVNIAAKDGQGVRTETSTVSVDTAGDTTQVRSQAPGDATRVTFILADDRPADEAPWRQVGFEARGPAGGPIVVATVRSKDREDGVFEAARELVTLNVGE